MGFETFSEAKSIFELMERNAQGKIVHLEKYKGRVCILVNISSKDPIALQSLQFLSNLKIKFPELVILAFPCCQFGPMESIGDILDVLDEHKIEFDEIFNIVEVNGPKASEIFKFLKYKRPGNCGSLIVSNFTLFVVNKCGMPVDRFGPNKYAFVVDEMMKNKFN